MKTYKVEYKCKWEGKEYHASDVFIAETADDAIAQCEQCNEREGCTDVRWITVWVDTGNCWVCV